VRESPNLSIALDQTRLDIVPGRKREQVSALQRRLHTRHSLAHQTRLLLPMLTHKTLGGEAAQQGEGETGVHVHGAGLSALLCDHFAMDITTPCVVALTWILSDAQGELIDELLEPVEFFYGGEDLLPKVEEALSGHGTGFEAALHLEPEHAFGEYDAELLCYEARDLFPDGVELGMQFEGLPEGAMTPDMPKDLLYTVTEVYPEHVVLDANHPLAGLALRIALKVIDVRSATAEEIEAGSVNESPLMLLGGAEPGPSIH
jgi:FKBP-type peptidyl-prolyl cis-trans isomerase SlyD